MPLAAANGLLAVTLGLAGCERLGLPVAGAADLRVGAQFGFMHTMATFAAFTLLRAGVRGAGAAPAPFLGGVVLFSGGLYARGLGVTVPGWVMQAGAALLVSGWVILLAAACELRAGIALRG
jgi:uncharacterized membrane protein YgdD (TMEM256/DUF423 family)